MATAWEPIEIQAKTYIKRDLELDWEAQNRPAVFYNRMAAYMKWSISLFNRPPDILLKLKDMTEPDFTDVDFTPTEDMESPAVINTGITGYDICSCGLIGKDAFGNTIYTPEPCEYNVLTGEVTINRGLTPADTLSLNFYKHGEFSEELNQTEQTILAYGIYCAWEHRFDNDAVERTSKIRDGSFSTISEASQTSANTARQKEVMQQLYGMMRQYESNRAYIATVLNGEI